MVPSFSIFCAFNPSPKSIRNALSGILHAAFPGVYILFTTLPPTYTVIGTVANAFSCATFTASVSAVPAATLVICRLSIILFPALSTPSAPTLTAALVALHVASSLFFASRSFTKSWCSPFHVSRTAFAAFLFFTDLASKYAFVKLSYSTFDALIVVVQLS